jgi:isopenicillin N synthase-like dioxygenase
VRSITLLLYLARHILIHGQWRAGPHTDIGCLTLLFQRDGEDGLEICPGRESHNSLGVGDTFYPLPAKTGPIVVNIGDMLRTFLPSVRALILAN